MVSYRGIATVLKSDSTFVQEQRPRRALKAASQLLELASLGAQQLSFCGLLLYVYSLGSLVIMA
jgi:regulator of sirC expression with transglutaminase-like and TPR domain